MLNIGSLATGTSARPTHDDICGRAGTSVALLDRFLCDACFDADDPMSLGNLLAELIDCGFDRLPLPGGGQTLARWQMLATVAAFDLGLVKLFEGHTDALAILAELNGPVPPARSRWGVWAAEPPDARVNATALPDGRLRLSGVKAWCSGARVVSHGLLTVWLDGAPVLASVDMRQRSSIFIDTSTWHAVGMRATASADVSFDGTLATRIGAPHAYVRRPGFWCGGVGVAACWYGASARLGRVLAEATGQRSDAHRLAHLGAIDVALSGAAAVLRETAASIDTDPSADRKREALRARLVVEAAATSVMAHATRALGAGPLCREAHFARTLADLPVFLRQSHAERDLAALGEALVESGNTGWTF
jgi:alkylation response protein AidB-like acyl-CoA dehydrogenase